MFKHRFNDYSIAISLLLLSINHAVAHSSPLNHWATQACSNKARSQSCQYQGVHDDLYIGTCQYMSTTLMCVRNQPIQKTIVDSQEQQKISIKKI